jgi:hypothetical protein
MSKHCPILSYTQNIIQDTSLSTLCDLVNGNHQYDLNVRGKLLNKCFVIIRWRKLDVTH